MNYKEGVKNYEAGKLAEASNDFSAAIDQNTNFADAYAFRGAVRLAGSNYSLAIEDFSRVIALQPGNAAAYSDRGMTLHALRQYAAAITNFDEAIRLNPEDVKAYEYRGIDRYRLRDWDGALSDLNAARTNEMDDPEIYEIRAAIFFARKEFESADTDATHALRLEDKAESHLIRGLARLGLKDSTNALADLNAANRLKPHQPEFLAARAIAEVYEGDLKTANEDLVEAAQLSPTNHSVWQGTGMLRNKSGDLEGALEAYSKAAESPPVSPESFLILGCVQDDLAKYSEALQSFRNAVQKDPRLYYAHFRIWLVRTRMGERDEATKELKASMKAREPDERHAWELCVGHFLAGELTESNLFAQAGPTAVRMQDIPGQQAEAKYYAGMRRLLDGDKSGAAELFEKCVASGQNNYAEYYSAKAELAKLKRP